VRTYSQQQYSFRPALLSTQPSRQSIMPSTAPASSFSYRQSSFPRNS
jgi:hypothetical protein